MSDVACPGRPGGPRGPKGCDAACLCLAVLLLLLCPVRPDAFAAAGPPEKAVLEMCGPFSVEPGLAEPWPGAKAVRPGSPVGPADKGFGCRFTLAGKPGGGPVRVEARLTRPTGTGRPAVERWFVTARRGEPAVAAYALFPPGRATPGDWTLELFAGDRRLAGETFTVLAAVEAVPPPTDQTAPEKSPPPSDPATPSDPSDPPERADPALPPGPVPEPARAMPPPAAGAPSPPADPAPLALPLPAALPAAPAPAPAAAPMAAVPKVATSPQAMLPSPPAVAPTSVPPAGAAPVARPVPAASPAPAKAAAAPAGPPAPGTAKKAPVRPAPPVPFRPASPAAFRSAPAGPAATAPAPAGPLPVASPPAAPAPVAGDKAGRSAYVLQTGFFTEAPNAEAQAARLRSRGMPACVAVEGQGGGRRYRVLAGRFGDARVAGRARDEVRTIVGTTPLVTRLDAGQLAGLRCH